MKYRVASTIVSGNIDNGEPVDVQWYNGDSLAVAMAASAQATANYLDTDERVPESMRAHTLEVRIEFLADCEWRDTPRTKRPWWAKVACQGREVDTEVGTLCAMHHAAMRNA